MSRMRRLFHALTSLMLLSAASAAHACPMCFGKISEDAIRRYFMSYAILSALPLAVIGGVIGWLVRAQRVARRAAADPKP